MKKEKGAGGGITFCFSTIMIQHESQMWLFTGKNSDTKISGKRWHLALSGSC